MIDSRWPTHSLSPDQAWKIMLIRYQSNLEMYPSTVKSRERDHEDDTCSIRGSSQTTAIIRKVELYELLCAKYDK